METVKKVGSTYLFETLAGVGLIALLYHLELTFDLFVVTLKFIPFVGYILETVRCRNVDTS